MLTYRILHSTASLLYLLQGTELTRQRILTAYDQYPPAIRHSAVCPPELSYVDIPLVENGPCFDLHDVLAREGEAEQLAFRGWVEEIYNVVWEGDLRNAFAAGDVVGSTFRPKTDALGDLRHIRNDLVKNGGIARKGETGKCAVLKWFTPGERMVLNIGHVLDFLNQMAMLNHLGGFKPDGGSIRWTVNPAMREALEQRPTPKIVSLRTVFIGSDEAGTSHHGICVAFDNGVPSNIPIEYPADGTPIENRIANMERTHIDENGDVRLFNGTVRGRRDLYLSGVAVLFGDVPQDDKPLLPGPWLRIRE